MKKFIQFFTKTQTGRALLIAAAVLALAYGGKVYYTHQQESTRTRDARDAKEMLTAMADALDAHLEAEGDSGFEQLPTRTDWFPARLPCGAPTLLPEPEGVWDTMELEAKSETRFQFRFERGDDSYTLLARRDSDCDGLHYVVRQVAEESVTGGYYRTTETQNASE